MPGSFLNTALCFHKIFSSSSLVSTFMMLVSSIFDLISSLSTSISSLIFLMEFIDRFSFSGGAVVSSFTILIDGFPSR